MYVWREREKERSNVCMCVWRISNSVCGEKERERSNVCMFAEKERKKEREK